MASSKLEKLQEQVEYYLSDENLTTDDFFRNEIKSTPEGFVNINVFQKCNKIKKMGVTNDQIIESIKESKNLELNSLKTGIRRKNNQELPIFEGSRKKIKIEEKQKYEEKKENNNKQQEEELKKEPLIFSVGIQGLDLNFDWKDLQSHLEKDYGKKVIYCRLSKTEKTGNFSLNKNEVEKELIEKIEKNGLKINETIVKIHLTKDKELEEFWQKHGGHYTLCQDKGRDNKKDKKRNKNDRKSKEEARKRERKENRKVEYDGEIVFGDKKYSDSSKLKDIFKQILSTTPNGQEIKEPHHNMLKNILEFHELKDQKLQNLKNFTVEVHPEHPETRCFFIVKNDGAKEDFSISKCIDRLVKQYEK